MNSVTHITDRVPGCGCFPGCLDIATGVLMQRHGITADNARAALLRSAKRQGVLVHARAQHVIDSATNSPPPQPC